MKGKSINLKALVLLCAFISYGLAGFGQHFTESFENSSGWSGYTTGTVTFTSGDWDFVAVYPESSSASYDGSKACRINDDVNGASITSPSVNTVGTVSFYYHRPYSGTGSFELQKSVGGGAFTTLATVDFSGVTTPTFYSFDVNDARNDIKIRIVNDDNSAHLTIDFITIGTFASCSGQPTAQATDITFSNETTSSIDVSWTAGTGGDNYILVAKEAGNVSWTPTDGADYSGTTASGDFSSATDQGSGNKVVYSGSGTSATITGLSLNTAYHFQVFHYCSNSSDDYLATAGSGNDGSQTTSTLDLSYCNPSPSSVDGNGIVRVEMGTIDNSTGTETNNYGDYSAQSADVNPNTTVNVDITYETGYTYNTKIYIDWNNDKDFDDSGEEVYSGESLSANPTTLNASFSVPQSQATGTYRVRIGGADSGPVTPCYTGSYGSFEDYTINVVAATASPEPSNHVSGFTVNGASTTQSSITLDWSDNDGAEVAAGFLIVGKTGSGSYAAVSDNNAVADDSDWSNDNFSVNVGHGVETYQVTGLDAGTAYDFAIYPYSNSGANIDYKTSATVPTTQGTTTSAPPSISNISHSPVSPTSSDLVTVTADVTDSDGVFGVDLNWGTASGSLGNTVSMTLSSGSTYTADIPAQLDGTTVYYEIYAMDDNGSDVASAEQSYTVDDPASTTLPYTADFTSGFGDCFAYSTSGATKEWSASSSYLSMNGYNSGDVEEDWVVLPSINLDNYSNEIMTFETYYKYGSNDANNYLKLMYSTDYAGSGDPSTANWTELSFTLPSSASSWVSSGNIDLSGVSGTTVWIAFKYRGITNGYRLWQVDNINIEETAAGMDSDSEVDNPTTQVNPGTISSIKDTEAEAIEVFKFDILDWGTSDGQATDVTQITINAGSNNNADWSSQIQGAKLSLDGGSTFVTTNSVSINASSLVFSINSGNLTIADGDIETVSLFIYLNTSVIDGEILQFEIPTASHGFVADASGSGFASSFSNTVTSNQITIAVEATDLVFGQQPSNVSANSVMTPSPTVSYVDANGNVDVDYDGAGYEISLSTTGSFDATATTSVAPVSGVSTFSNLVFDASGNALTVTATDGGWTSASTVSSTFNVAGTPLYIQDFDGSTPTWGYSSDVTLFDNGWGSDGYYGVIDLNQASPLAYSNFSGNVFGENDLDDEGNGTTGFATLTLEGVDIHGYVNVELSFDWEVVGYNATNDDAKYIVYYDGVSQGEVDLHDGSGSIDDADGTVSISVPDNVGTLSLEVMIRNNGGSGYSGFDNFRIDGSKSPVLVVTEMMIEPTQVSDANGEWFEVFNQSAYEVDMQNYVISDAGGESFTISSSFVVPAKGLVVFGTNGNNGTNGGYDPDYVYAFNDFALDNTGDEIIISDGSGSKAEIDRVEYTAAWVTPGHANVFTGTEADDNNDFNNWEIANSTYGMGDAGSPGNSGEDEQSLPIELLSFDAEKGNHAVELLWSTATELNNDYFTIQRSTDGQHFQSIGQLYGAGSTHEQQNYTYIDHELFEGTVYYRLKQTDYDGQYSYSHTIALNAKDSELEIAELRVNETGIDLLLSQVVEDMNIQLFDAGGRLVYQGSLQGASAHIPNQRFEKGIYILRLYNNHVVLNKKLQL